MNELFEQIRLAQQKLVDKGVAPNLQYNERATLDYARFIDEEVNEVIQCFSFRKPWKPSQLVDSEEVREELSDVFIMWALTVMYAGMGPEEIIEAIIKKLNKPRPDWLPGTK